MQWLRQLHGRLRQARIEYERLPGVGRTPSHSGAGFESCLRSVRGERCRGDTETDESGSHLESHRALMPACT